MSAEPLEAVLARLLPPVPVCAHPDCRADLLDVRRGSRYCSSGCQRDVVKRSDADRARTYRARKGIRKLEDHAHLRDVANNLIEQTRKRARGAPLAEYLTPERIVSALLEMPVRDRGQVIQIAKRSPETTKRDDAMHRLEDIPREEFEAEVERNLADAHPDIEWCHRNRAAGVLTGGTLGYLTRSNGPPKRKPRVAGPCGPLTIIYGPPQESHAGEDRPEVEPERGSTARSIGRAQRDKLRGCAWDRHPDDHWRGDPRDT